MKESMAFRPTLCLVLVLSLAVACSTQEHYRTKGLMKLQLGMSKEEVLSIMGTPQRQESYGDTEVLFYTTDEFSDRKETDTPLTITRGRLVGWGHLDYERVVRAHDAMPKERSAN
jgi:outer membrane protein assembly factor BamE (lipoprotein component of BamABCDE complex)